MPTIAETWIQEGRQEGQQEGLLAGIELALRLRFGAEGARLLSDIRRLRDTERLKALLAAIETVQSPDDLRRFYQSD